MGDGLPLLIDCRKPGEPKPVDFQRKSSVPQGSVEFPFRDVEQPEPGLVRYSVSLPCLGRVEEVPPRHFII